MTTGTMNRRTPLWANMLKLIPLLVTISVIALLLVYKPEGYLTIVGGFVFAYVFGAVLFIWSTRRARARKTK